MKNTSYTHSTFAGLDTLVVLFFLAVEYGRGAQVLRIDAILISITMAMVLVLPYFLPMRSERPRFSSWMLVRTAFAAAGLVLGIALRQSTGTLLPETARFMPMTFLILAAMVSCYIQYYSLMRLRPVK